MDHIHSIDLSSYDDGSIIELGVADDDDDCVSEAAEFVLDSWDLLSPVLDLDVHLSPIGNDALGNNALRRLYAPLDMTFGNLMSLSPLRWSGRFETSNMSADLLSRYASDDATRVGVMEPRFNSRVMNIGLPHWIMGDVDGRHFRPNFARRGPRRIWGENDRVLDDVGIPFVLDGRVVNVHIVSMRYIDDLITTVSVVNGKFLFLLFIRVLYFCDDDLIITGV